MKWPMVQTRGKSPILYLRVLVPRRLQAQVGAKEIWRSMRTADPELAKARALVEEKRIRADLARLDGQPSPALEPAHLAGLYKAQALATDLEHRIASATKPRDEDASWAEETAITSRLEELEENPALIHDLVDKVLFRYGQHVPLGERAPYAAALLAAERAVLKEQLVRVQGHFDPGQEANALGPTLDELVEAYVTDRQLPHRTAKDTRALMAKLGRVLGGGGTRRARTVGVSEARRWRQHVLGWDRSVSTRKKALLLPATVWRFGLQAGLVESNPFQGMTSLSQRGSAQEPTRLPYTPAQVRVLLSECEKLTGARRWIVPLLAHSGMRVEEACGARAQDVKKEQGVWFLDLAPTKDRRLKTRGAARRIPIHPRILDAGFLDYVASLPADGQLWPDLVYQKGKAKYSVQFGRWFASWSGRLGHGLDDSRVVLHSLRHSFKRACRDAGLEESTHDELTGHVTPGIGRRYGMGSSLPALAKAIAKVTYDED